MKVLLVRHGESTWNAQGRYQGRRDAPLSERGRAQARALADHLAADASLRPAAIVSSPLSRARDTAEIVAREVHVDVDVDANLIEISHGEWEGLLKSEIAKRWPALFEDWQSRPQTVRFPGGESLADVRDRWRHFLSGIDGFASPLLIVTHDVIVRLAVLEARGQALSAFNALTSENAAVNEFEFASGSLHLVALNERAHLGAHRVDPASQAL